MFGVQWDLVLAFLSKDTTKITSTDVLTKNSTTIGNYSDSAFQLRKTGKYALFSNYSLSSTWSLATTATEGYVDSGRNKLTQSSIANGTLVTTGTSEQSKVMNIYDVAGNVGEWTLEKAASIRNPCACRGGDFSSAGLDFPAAGRISVSRDVSSNGFVGFRVSLF